MTDQTSPQWEDQPEAGDATEQAMPEMRMQDMLLYVIGEFANFAWIHLGIQSNPMTKETKVDLPEAKLAIDAVAALVPLTEGRFDAHTVRDLHNLLSSLQLNYVQRIPSAS